jgi:hypothetical protein
MMRSGGHGGQGRRGRQVRYASRRLTRQDSLRLPGQRVSWGVRAALLRYPCRTSAWDSARTDAAAQRPVYRVDDEMLVTPYLYRLHGYQNPLLYLKRLGRGICGAVRSHLGGVASSGLPGGGSSAACGAGLHGHSDPKPSRTHCELTFDNESVSSGGDRGA